MTDLTHLLRTRFGFASFRPGQEETLTSILAGQDTLAILPTGAGKSLLYQLPAYQLPGTILIISPLISLMQDQADRIARQGDFKEVVLNSQLGYADQQAILQTLGDYRFIFTSPETLSRGPVLGALRQLTISLFVVDEAHCISEWGPDFRPEYLLLADCRRHLQPAATLLLTATATKRVEADILVKLGLDPGRVKVVRQSVNRPNLFLAVHQLGADESKLDYLAQRLPQLGGPGVIYFSSRKQAAAVADQLSRKTGLRLAAYHAGLDPIARFRLQNQFMANQIDVICATSAFGMGIDKNDLRYVIHYHMPNSVAAYTQEIGRAGRDGQPALALLLYQPGDEGLPTLLSQVELPPVATMHQYLKGKSSPQILGERANVISFYLSHGYTPEQLVDFFAAQRPQALRRIQQMLGYVQETGCRRAYLMRCFDESAVQQELCCDCHQPNWQPGDLGLHPLAKEQAAAPRLDWRGRLMELLGE